MNRRLINDYDLLQPWALDKQLKSGVKVFFGDNREFSIRYDAADSAYVVRDETSGTDILKVTSGGVSVSGEVRSDTVSADTVKSKDALLNKTATPAVSNSPTEVTVVAPDADHIQVVPIGGSIAVGGTFASGETVDVTIIAHYSDGTTGSITKTYTATETTDLTLSDIVSLIKDGVYITEIGAEAKTSLTTTSSVTVSVTIAAWQREHDWRRVLGPDTSAEEKTPQSKGPHTVSYLRE